MKPHTNNITFICILYTLGILHLTLFLYEFFPVKTKYDGTIIPPPNHINGTSLNAKDNYIFNTNRVIFMVIDALRNDFINKDNMPYAHATISSSGCHITTKVESPTVTMPRIKAMTTGTLPQYIDILLNFQSVEVVEDSWLQRAKDAGKNIVFYGDNTWQKLYPDMFHRSEGTTSFFVTDFTEVDDNVTRHLNNELLHKKDWDILILHYLGLDHIGHIHGPFHELINSKLNEMDDVVKTIHSYLQKDDVFIISGDHGMRDLGGHGGSTEPEILVPFVVLNKACRKYRNYEVKQTDIPSTLSALMALPLPAQSVGKIIHDFLPYESVTQNLYFLYYNALNLIKMDTSKYTKEFEDVFQGHVNYLTNPNNINHKLLIQSYEEKIVEISNELLKSSTMDQNVSFLYVSICSLALICLKLVFLDTFQYLYLVNFLITLSLSFLRVSVITTIYSFILCLCLMYSCFRKFHRFYIKLTTLNLILLGMMFRTVSMLSSSYIEFEQYIWYFLWTSVTIFFAYNEYGLNKVKCFLWVVVALGVRLARNILDWKKYIWIIFLAGLIGLIKHSNHFITIPVSILIFMYRYYSETVYVAQMAKLLILTTSVLTYIKHRNINKTLINTWLLWSALLMRPYNVILLPLCLGTSHILFQLISSIETLTLLHIWLEETLFYSQGFDNNFSSVDISPGYIGLHEYSLLFTTFQVVCHTYVFRVLPLLLLMNRLVKHRHRVLHIYILNRMISFTFYCFVILIHRHHIFIWSVFSPKLLIESCHAVCLFILVVGFTFISKCNKYNNNKNTIS